jgi:Fur family ferric uptake transcriptional regulator
MAGLRGVRIPLVSSPYYDTLSHMLSTVQKEWTRYEDFLKKQGLRFSRGRQSIFQVVMRTHAHFTAEEMAKTCLQMKPAVSRATVYRIIRETAFGDKHKHFEHLYDEQKHHHAICVRCHQHIEFPDMDEEKRYHPILEKKGFKILGHEMHFYGICSSCQRKEKI